MKRNSFEMKGPSNNPIADFFGPHRRRPLKSNTLSALAKIYSLFPDHDPFGHFSLPAQTPAIEPRRNARESDAERPLSDDLGDVLVPRSEKEACEELVGPPSMEVGSLSVHSEANNDGNAVVLDEGDRLNDSEMIIDESGGTNQIKTVENMVPDNKGMSDGDEELHNVQEDLLGIERILMDESDYLDQLQLPDEDVNLDLFHDFGSFMDTDVFGKDSMPVESNTSGKLPIEGNVKDDEAGEKRRKELEVKRSSLGGDVASLAQVSVEKEVSIGLDAMDQSADTCPENVGKKEIKLCKEKVPQDLSQTECLTFSAKRRENEGGSVSIDKFVGSTVEKGKKSRSSVKEKTKKGKKVDLKDVKSGKSKSLAFEAFNSTKPGGSDPVVVHGKMLKQNVVRKGISPTRKVGKCSESRESIQYTREQLQQLKQMAAIPDDILKAVQETCTKLLGENQNLAPGDSIDASCSNERQPGTLSEDMKMEEKGSGLSKNKKRGSSSEAKKEKKKRKRREKRAEMNRKLGVKRLKLRPPVLKPKVVSHCRHYLKGRCQEGEKCKFSHDVIPLTKSKPCCHFARQACMKGDDCPFDHLLSKYPCNNYLSTGLCGRGDSCLFSHKIQDKEGLEPAVGVFKEIKSPDKLDKSNSKQQRDVNLPSSSRIATPNILKETSVTKTGQPAQAPKGLSFLSFGKSPQDSAKPKEADSLLQRSVDLSKQLMGNPASTAPRGIGFLSFEKTSADSSRDKKQAKPLIHRDNSSLLSFGKSLIPESTNDKQVGPSQESENAVGKGNLLNRGTLSRGISFPSLDGPSYDNSGDKIQAILPSTGYTNSQISVKEKRIATETENVKAKQPESLGDPASSGQFSIRVGGPVKSTSSKAQNALLSTLAFAAKLEPGIKMSSSSATMCVDKNEGTSSGSGGRQNEATKASAILEFLYSGGNKQKQ